MGAIQRVLYGVAPASQPSTSFMISASFARTFCIRYAVLTSFSAVKNGMVAKRISSSSRRHPRRVLLACTILYMPHV
eukprot:CAMPEP_0119073428 /NCGR_PEP_ID=MMETSP1178-20130426/65276_1 /TAXON_ID=33656 /ORGANISM="unid sp, Strain CCMP2000" /LENGTH=76 /DNA_ID=CAMNT_0007055507 /DNA_START=396 /DNA_END=626 /DNA_ORIENTATION=-